MTWAPLGVRWIAGDAARVRAALAAVLGIEVPAGHPIAMPGLRLRIVEAEPGPGDRAPDRLEVAAADPGSAAAATAATADDAMSAGARFLALGWATVDMDLVAAAWAGVRWTAVPRDSLVGARALLGDPARTAAADAGVAGSRAGPAVTTVLLEPDTEGRLAASLSRHGEGPAVLYVGLPAAAIDRARTRLAHCGIPVSAGSGPFGPAIAIAGKPASSPTLIVVPARGTNGRDGAARGGRGTIRP